MALRKPSEFFKDKKQTVSIDESVKELDKTPELNTFSEAFNAFKDNLSKIEVLSAFTETLDTYKENVERVNFLSGKVEDIQTEILNLLKKEDLDRAMMSQLLVVEQSIQEVQNKVKGINQENLNKIRLDVSGLTESVNEFLENEAPRYKKLVVESELRTHQKYEELEENVSQVLENISEFVENKYQQLTETLDGINQDAITGILNDFETLEQVVLRLKEQEIPKYKNLIVETELKSETKLNKFQEELNETVSSLLEKMSLIEDDKSNLVEEVTERIADVNNLSEQVARQLIHNEDYKKEITKKVSQLEGDIIRNESHIRSQNKSLEQIQENVRSTISKLNLEEIENQNYELGKKVKYLEEIFEKFNEREILTEGLLNEPPEVKNEDPLTPLDQNFVTLDQLQQHYRLFINRIQQQLATIGGGGETRLEFLDDVDRDSAKQDGYVLQYSSSSGKFIGTSYVPGSGAGGTSYWVGTNAGIYTTGNVAIGTNVVSSGSTALWVQGDARITGILSVGQGTVTIDGNTNTISATNVNATNISATSFTGTATTATYLADAANILTGTINKDRISTTNGLTVLGDLYVSNNISFGGTTTQLNTQQLQIVDADIVLGIGTSFSPTDNTANHGGIAIASTEGTPLVSLNIVPGETNPYTYKKFMWFKGSTIGAGLTDAWLANYAIGIGSTQVPNGVRLAAGNVKITENDISTVRNINASGIVTGSSFRPSSGYYQSANGTNSFYVYDGTGNVAFQGTIGASQINSASGYKALDFGTSTTPSVNITNGLNVGTGGTIITTTGIGSVGIGTTNPTAKLDVRGNVNVSGIVTASNGTLISGVGVSYNNVSVGNTITSINFTGTGISTVTVSSNTVTINIAADVSPVMMGMIF